MHILRQDAMWYWSARTFVMESTGLKIMDNFPCQLSNAILSGVEGDKIISRQNREFCVFARHLYSWPNFDNRKTDTVKIMQFQNMSCKVQMKQKTEFQISYLRRKKGTGWGLLCICSYTCCICRNYCWIWTEINWKILNVPALAQLASDSKVTERDLCKEG